MPTDRPAQLPGDARDGAECGTPDGRHAVVIFAPLPVLTVTIEDRLGEADIHVHAGGQGVWQSRMMSSLGVPVVLCCGLGGEMGNVLGHLLPMKDVSVQSVPISSRNGAYVHDRRTGERDIVAEAAGSPLDRHELDSLYELTLTEGLTHGRVLLSGPQGDRVLPHDFYRRLATDLEANGCKVAADLAGERLEAVLAGRPNLIKVSHEELLADGRAKSEEPDDLVVAMRTCATRVQARLSYHEPAPRRRWRCSMTRIPTAMGRGVGPSSKWTYLCWKQPILQAPGTP
ncbi:hypothetical protein [Mycobacterium asiaticum]|uniref:hypothetical protein n=1 Tax=Mycobacterium asiaticum TaxID=1790 RepID=UPI0034622948